MHADDAAPASATTSPLVDGWSPRAPRQWQCGAGAVTGRYLGGDRVAGNPNWPFQLPPIFRPVFAPQKLEGPLISQVNASAYHADASGQGGVPDVGVFAEFERSIIAGFERSIIAGPVRAGIGRPGAKENGAGQAWAHTQATVPRAGAAGGGAWRSLEAQQGLSVSFTGLELSPCLNQGPAQTH